MSQASLNNQPRPEPGPYLRWFDEGELKCAWPPCSKPMPAGYYGMTKRIYHCSNICCQRCYFDRKKPLKCLHCGRKFNPRKNNRGKPFCSAAHYRAWTRDQNDKKRLGRFGGIVNDFLEDAKARLLSKSSLVHLRGNLSRFFEYAQRKRLRSVETIKPRHISEFMAEHQIACPKSGGRAAVDLHTFFDWAIRMKYRKATNPVVLSFHSWTAPRGKPRPYTQAELATIRSLVKDDPQLKVAVEIGAESGLRISEVVNLRVQDVDLERQVLFVRLPTKTRVERYVPFHDRTREALECWLKLRPDTDHNFLFVGRNNRPLRKYTLRLNLNRIICGPGGLARFNFHRLRHTAASAVHPALNAESIKRTFGWQSNCGMQTYTEINPNAVRKSYLRAMNRIEQEKLDPHQAPTSIEAFFASQNAMK
jgi:site-specific recombinase XerD